MSTNKTQRLGLHRWEQDDPFLREEFNENFETLDSLAVTGTYTGNAPYADQMKKQDITLGFRPRLVAVISLDSSSSNYGVSDWASAGFAVAMPGFPRLESDGKYTTLEVTDTGFRVGGLNQYLNYSGAQFGYLAIK